MPGVLRSRLPAFAETIRFRLSLGIALVVFTLGSLVIGGLYLWEEATLVEPVLMKDSVTVIDGQTGRVIVEDLEVVFPEEEQRVMMEKFELDAYRRALLSLRTSSYIALTVLFFGSFLAGWLLSGWALKPIRRITGVAQGITASDLGRRIGLRGANDELRAMGDTFDSMLDRLEVAFDDQRRFVAEASHELRNPLAVARTNLELALSGGTEAEVRAAAAIAHDATDRMSGLVDEMLNQTRSSLQIDATEDVDLAALAREVASDHRAAGRKRNVAVDVVVEASASGLVVKGDALALRRAANNLVSNAIRLAPTGSTVCVEVARADQMAQLSVVDQGPGLDEDARRRVFDEFWQGNDANSEGAGLGLAIVRRIAERHGGAASVDAAGLGSRFSVRLPAAQPPALLH